MLGWEAKMVLYDTGPAAATRESAPASAAPTYSGLLRLDRLLDLPHDLGGQRDGLFFVAVHQVTELWFAVVLAELELARDALLAAEVPPALYALGRVASVERVLVDQLDTLKTISPAGFRSLRGGLASASGFQSVQFREIEFLSGLKDRTYPRRAGLGAAEAGRLHRRLSEPTLWDAFEALLAARGEPDLVRLLRGEVPDDDVLRVAEALLDHDEGFALWRAKHVQMVERLIGQKPGTGGSPGAPYLRSRLPARFFPQLWELRSRL
jgi:tryptophan 2,3-dioxygenase